MKNNKAKWIFAAIAASVPVSAQAETTKGTACPEFLGDKADQGMFTLLSDTMPVTIQLNGGELKDTVVSLSYDAVHLTKDGQQVQMNLGNDPMMKKADTDNVFGQDLYCSAMAMSFGGNSLLVMCGQTTINMTDTDIFVQMKDSVLRKAENWCETAATLPAPNSP